jgi:hypothetical protein
LVSAGASTCSDCIAGKFSTTEGATAVDTCLGCPAGKFSTTEGASAVDTCLDCVAGKYKSTQGVNTACDDCVAGKYKAAAGVNTACDDCVAGKFSSVAGSVSENDCNIDIDSTTVRMVVFLPVTAAEFDVKKQQTFKEAIATTAGPNVRADHVIIEAIKESTAARRLLNQGISIDVRVNAVDKSAADAIAARLTKDSINAGLTSVGLPPATLLEAAAVVTTANGNRKLSLLLGPQLTVGVTSAVSIGFAGVAALVVKDFPIENMQEKVRVLVLIDLMDTIVDWGSWAGTNAQGDFTFSNDRDGIVNWTLFAISNFGTVLFLVSTYLICHKNGARHKYLLILQLGFENFAQGLLYVFVAASQASTSKGAMVYFGIVQSLIFCVYQVYELKNHRDIINSGTDGNPGEGSATPPPAFATTPTGRGGVVFETSPQGGDPNVAPGVPPAVTVGYKP